MSRLLFAGLLGVAFWSALAIPGLAQSDYVPQRPGGLASPGVPYQAYQPGPPAVPGYSGQAPPVYQVQDPGPVMTYPTPTASRVFSPPPPQGIMYMMVGPWIQAEGLAWWVKDRALPPLVTTSTSQESLGVLGQPDTSVLFGGSVDGEVRYGARISAGVDCVFQDGSRNSMYRCGVEAVGFFLRDRRNDFVMSSSGNPVLARPFFDVTTGQQFSEQVANFQVGTIPPGPGARPDFARAFIGTIQVESPSRIYGGELNTTWEIPLQPPGATDGPWLRGLIGFRHFALEEDLRVQEDLTLPQTADETVAPPVVLLPETIITIVDQFRTRNYFYGPQLGFKTGSRYGPFSFQVIGKAAVGWMDQRVEISGSNAITVRDIVTGQQLPTEIGQGGLLAQPTNIGVYARRQFACIPEATLEVGWNLTPGLRVFGGYNLLFISTVVRPGDIIDIGVDPRIRGGGAAPTDATRPAFVFSGSDMWIQGLQVGLDLRY